MSNDDDILETALNSGIPYTAEKFNVSQKYVGDLVRTFQNEIEDFCDCEKSGKFLFCMICSGHRIGSGINNYNTSKA